MDDTAPQPSFWVELYGGPYDGDMYEMPNAYNPDKPVALGIADPDIVIDGHRTPAETSSGLYATVGWLDQELGIVRMQWYPENRLKRRNAA